MRSSWK
jgi:hypothetical protein